MPPKLNLTSEHLEPHGLFLIENGMEIILFLGRGAVDRLCLDVFGAPNYAQLRAGKITLPELDNSMNKRVNAIIARIRSMRRGPYRQHVQLAKEDAEPALRLCELPRAGSRNGLC
jgi:protein transport protein SEC24